MEIKLYELVNAAQLLQELAAKRMPAGLAMRVARNMRKILPEVSDFDETRRKRIIELAGKEPAEGEMISVPLEMQEAFTDEMSAALEETLDLDLRKLPLAEVEKIMEFTPQEIALIEFLIEE